MKLVVWILLFLIVPALEANDSLRTERERINSFGFKLNYISTKHFADFSQLPDAPSCCPKYTNANGNGFEFGIIYQEFLTKTISIAPSVGFIKTDGLFKSIEEKKIIINNSEETAEIEHNLLTNLYFLYLETGIIYNLFKSLNFMTAISLDYLAEANFEQKELLIKPENRGTFENGRRTRNEISGKISGANKFNFFLKAGINYELPLNKTKSITLLPSATISAGLNNLLPENKWGIIHLSIGFTILFNNYLDYSTPIEPKHRN
ncbi:MAG: hypothetical protein N2319_11620 [Candidatus Kapabacteria bacterium]|nr:hypothetical protein [Candidatus Kapabacteria bacterium]